MGKTVDVLKFYAAIRNFIKSVIINKHQLLQDLVFVHNKIHLLKTSENDMLKFYNLEEKYMDVKIKSAPFDAKDQKFSIHFKQINNYTVDFNNEVKKIGVAAADLFKLNDFFTNEITQLEHDNYDHAVVNALDKFDKVLMMTVKLVEMKIDIENSIGAMKGGMIELKDLRLKVEADILNIERLTEFYLIQQRAEGVKKSVKGVRMLGSVVAFVVGLLFVW